MRYIKIRRTFIDAEQSIVLLHLIDISDQLKPIKSQVEEDFKRVLRAQVNLMVSHKMCNPLNQIFVYNLVQAQSHDKL